MKAKYILMAMLAIASTGFTACSDDNDPVTPPTTDEGGQGETTTVGETVSGVWTAGSTINVSGHHITVPEGQTLTIEPGVTIIFDDAGVGTSHTPIEFIVDGSLYCEGTAEAPIRFTVAEDKRTADNAFAGLWGGIVATENCPELLLDHVIIEYTGGAVSQDSPSALLGIYTPGDDFTPHLTTNNVDGRYVVRNSTLRYGVSDAIYMMGGQASIVGNTFEGNGETGGEAINVKAGCRVDAAFNLMYSPNTNGLKLSSSGQNDESGRHQALVRAYNNTIVNAGWRRDGVKGGCIYVEKQALVSVFNNLLVNCKFRAMTPSWGNPGLDDGAALDCVIDHNFYAAGTAQSDLAQDVEEGTTNPYLSLTAPNEDVYADAIDVNSVFPASAGDAATDPQFVNFPYLTNALTGFTLAADWDFHVQSGSPVLSGAYTGSDANMQPFFGTTGLSVGGTVYTTPAAAPYFGAFGTL